MTAFPHPGDDYPSLHRDAGVYGVCEPLVERLCQTFETADFGAYHSAGDVEIGIAKRPMAECRWLWRLGSRAGIDRHRIDPPPSMARLMRKDVLLRPALEIKQNPMRQELEASAGQCFTALAHQHRVESGA